MLQTISRSSGTEHAQAVLHVGDRLVEALELLAQFALHAMALGDVLAQGHPAAVVGRVIVQQVFVAAAQVLILLERLARRHLLQPPLPHPLGRRLGEVSARRHGVDHVAHRDADPDDVLRQAVHLEERPVEQHDAVLGIDRAQAVRHVVQGLLEPLELDAQVVLPALELGHVLDQRDPAAIGERAIVHVEHAPVLHAALEPERLAARHQLAPAPHHLVELREREIARASAEWRITSAIGMPTPHRLGHQVEDLDEAPIVQGQPLRGVDHAEPVRHAFERRLMQREQLLELAGFGRAAASDRIGSRSPMMGRQQAFAGIRAGLNGVVHGLLPPLPLPPRL